MNDALLFNLIEILALFKEHDIKLAKPQRVLQGNVVMTGQDEKNLGHESIVIKKAEF